MSFPAAVLCVHLPGSALEQFQACLENVRELWLPGFHLFETAKNAFDALLALQAPKLSRSFQAQGIIIDVFLLDAWLTLFARWLPFRLLPEVLEYIRCHGFAGILSLTVAVVDAHGASIGGVEPADALLELWKCLQWEDREPRLDTLFQTAQGLRPRASELLAERLAANKLPELAFQRRGPRVVHPDSGIDLLDVLSEQSWQKWRAQAEEFRNARSLGKGTPKSTKSLSFLGIFRCGRVRAESDSEETPPSKAAHTE